MQRRESICPGATIAPVGQASMHLRQVPHVPACGESGVSSMVVTISPSREKDPSSGLIRSVFFP